jgi:hypothetical protein
MDGYVLQHTTKGTYVTRQGDVVSYTLNVNRIRVYDTQESARRDMCAESEVIRRLDDVMTQH